MNNKIVVVVTTLLGTAGGFACGWLLAKKKYEGLADSEVESVKTSLKEYYENREPIVSNNKTEETSKSGIESKASSEPKQTKDVGSYHDYGKQYRSSESDKRVIDPEQSGVKNIGKNEPYVISPDDYNASSNKSVTLWYTDDHVLCDDDGNEIRNYADMIGGPEVFTHFGEYEQDSIYVRNDISGIDYEILLDHKLYYKSTPTNRYTIPEEDEN